MNNFLEELIKHNLRLLERTTSRRSSTTRMLLEVNGLSKRPIGPIKAMVMNGMIRHGGLIPMKLRPMSKKKLQLDMMTQSFLKLRSRSKKLKRWPYRPNVPGLRPKRPLKPYVVTEVSDMFNLPRVAVDASFVEDLMDTETAPTRITPQTSVVRANLTTASWLTMTRTSSTTRKARARVE